MNHDLLGSFRSSRATPPASTPLPGTLFGRQRTWWIFFSTLFLACLGFCRTPTLSAAEVIPPAPRDHFNDYAGTVRGETARQLETALTQFERDTSNQILVVIYPRMQSESSIEDYTFRVKEAWKVGLKGRNNGAVLFIFSQDRKLFVQVGYGLESVLPDALCKRIIEEQITPRFRQGDFDGGVRAGTLALMAAARGEYTGTGRTVADQASFRIALDGRGGFFFIVIALILLSAFSRMFRRNTLYSRRGRISPWIGTGGWGGGWGGGGGGGGGGSFSGGGGSGGGGGAGGSW